MTDLPTSRPGDLWISVSMPSMTEIHAKYFDSYVIWTPVAYPSAGKLETRMNLSAFVRDVIAEAVKVG